MTIEAKIIADSISKEGKRITTMQLRYPRFIHSEFMTHRVFSRNASSSRAIPVAKMIEDLRRDPAMPVFWGSNKPGMQAGAEIDNILNAKEIWLQAMEDAIFKAGTLINLGLHKQIANRILEPWAHINVVVTATEWANFFALRDHADAQPEIKVLAQAMKIAMGGSQPTLIRPGQWHLPFIHGHEETEDWDLLKKVSTARCARVSYLTHDGRRTTVEEDLALYQKLVVDDPLHASPAEHQATPDIYEDTDAAMSRHCSKHNHSANWKEGYAWEPAWANHALHANFVGWIQHRKTLPNEYVSG